MEIRLENLEGGTAMSSRIPTKYPGVYYREAARRTGKGVERVYYILFKKEGKLHEEKVGRQYADDMTPAKAAMMRAERIEGKRMSRKELREAGEEARKIEQQKITIGKIWNEYQQLNSSKKSLITDKYNFNNHLTGFIDKKPDDIITIDIQRLRHHLELKGLRPASVKHVLVLLRMLINWGIRQGLCPKIDNSKLYFDIPKLDNEKTEILSMKQIEDYEDALDKEPDQNLAALFRLALVTGMRKSALLNLKWDDCDFENRLIVLRGEISKKGKTEWIPMNDAAYAILMKICQDGGEYIFPGRDGGPRKEIRRMAQRVKANAGLPKEFRPLHGLRHAYASHLISSGKVDLFTLQKLLTHSSPKMTQRYAHLADDTLRKAAKVADEMFKKPTEEKE